MHPLDNPHARAMRYASEDNVFDSQFGEAVSTITHGTVAAALSHVNAPQNQAPWAGPVTTQQPPTVAQPSNTSGTDFPALSTSLVGAALTSTAAAYHALDPAGRSTYARLFAPPAPAFPAGPTFATQQPIRRRAAPKARTRPAANERIQKIKRCCPYRGCTVQKPYIGKHIREEHRGWKTDKAVDRCIQKTDCACPRCDEVFLFSIWGDEAMAACQNHYQTC